MKMKCGSILCLVADCLLTGGEFLVTRKELNQALGYLLSSTAMKNDAIWRGKGTVEIVSRMYKSYSFRTCSLYFVIDSYARQVYHKKRS